MIDAVRWGRGWALTKSFAPGPKNYLDGPDFYLLPIFITAFGSLKKAFQDDPLGEIPLEVICCLCTMSLMFWATCYCTLSSDGLRLQCAMLANNEISKCVLNADVTSKLM